MKNLLKSLQLSVVAISVLVVGCGVRTGTIAEMFSGQDIIGNRPSTPESTFMIVKLKLPALLDSAVQENGVLKVDQNLRAAVLQEQEQAIAKMQTVAPELKVLYRYSMTMNGLAVVLPTKNVDDLKKVSGLASSAPIQVLSAPKVLNEHPANAEKLSGPTPIQLIGADKAHQIKIKDKDGNEVSLEGQGIRVGIIDTGIDFTHFMMAGEGTQAAYKAVDPNALSVGYPNKKVLGGIDLVGTQYDAASTSEARRIPVPDDNPIDEQGHGTHVAGTVAGIGDNTYHYSGVAPLADLYAIKVFGASGSTSDSVVIAGMEYAVDPNGDGDLSDRLDVLNLSLGSDFGSARGYYREVLTRVDKAGIAVLIAAGNSGNFDYITGSPAVNDEALSVAASIDNSLVNTLFGAVAFDSKNLGHILTERVEGSVGKPISEVPGLKGKLVYIGLANEDLKPEQIEALRGNIALIDRGLVPFQEKVGRATLAGALGVVVANNQEGAPISMGGDQNFPIPAVMIPLELGARIKAEILSGNEVIADFTSTEKIERPELVDTITGFSSKGPRGGDSILKPEISAPGQNILSAAMGQGGAAVRFSGTSMATPHMAGVLALMKQAFPTLTGAELKSIAMGRVTPLKEGISRQGSGRVQVDRAVTSPIVTSPSSYSLGKVQIEGRKTMARELSIKNISSEAQELEVSFVTHEGNLKLQNAGTVKVAVGESTQVLLQFAIDARSMKTPVQEMSGWVILKKGSEEAYRIPVLAVVRKVSNVEAQSLTVSSDSAVGAEGSLSVLTLKNSSASNNGEALLFNLLGTDERKATSDNDRKFCDLEAVGYRIVTKYLNQEPKQVLQVVGKFYEPLTTFNYCELTVLIDGNGDGQPDQELAAISMDNVEGLSQGPDQIFGSVLFNFAKMREIRLEAEKSGKRSGEISYAPAVLGAIQLKPRNLSTVHMVEMLVENLAKTPTGELQVKVAALDAGGDDQNLGDDYYKLTEKEWMPISVQADSQSFVGLPETVEVKAGETVNVQFTKGQGSQPLMLLLPDNATVVSDVLSDKQMILVNPVFKVD